MSTKIIRPFNGVVHRRGLQMRLKELRLKENNSGSKNVILPFAFRNFFFFFHGDFK